MLIGRDRGVRPGNSPRGRRLGLGATLTIMRRSHTQQKVRRTDDSEGMVSSSGCCSRRCSSPQYRGVILANLSSGTLIRWLGGTVAWEPDADPTDKPFTRDCEYRWKVNEGLGPTNFDTRPNGPYTFYPTFVHPEVIALDWEGHSFLLTQLLVIRWESAERPLRVRPSLRSAVLN